MNRTLSLDRGRAALAALLAFLLIVAGAVVAEPARAAGPTVTAGVTAASETGLTVRVEASGLEVPEGEGVYAAIIAAGTLATVTASSGSLAMQYVRSLTDGGFTHDFSLPASALARGGDYEVIVWKQHTNPSASNVYAQRTVAVSSAHWDAVFPPAPAPEPEPEPEPGDGGSDPGDGSEPAPGDGGADPGQDGDEDPAPGSDPQPTFTPAVSVFLADGVTPAAGTSLQAGDRIVVKGTGYDPAANVGGRGMPIPSTLPQGTYVVFGSFAEPWRPSAGAPGSNRVVGPQAWALAESVLNQVPSQYQDTIRAQWTPLAADGTFTTTLTLRDVAAPAGGTYGVYTYGAGGVSNAAQEIKVALDYQPSPTVTTTVTAASDTGLTVRAVGRDFGSVTGAYAAVIEKGTESGLSAAGGYVAFGYWAVPGIFVNGGFDQTLSLPAAKLDRSKTYELVVWRTHSNPSAETIYARADIAVTDAQWDAVFPAVPTVSTTVTTATTDGLTLRAVGSNFGSVTGAYAAVIEKGTESGLSADGGYIAFGYWAIPGIFVNGGFDQTLSLPAAQLDRSKIYELVVWQTHTEPTAETIHARADISVTGAQWDAVFANTTPTTPTEPGTTPGATKPVAGGSMKWAVSSSFVSYITGSVAHGSVSVSGGATRAGGVFQFGQASGSTYDPVLGVGTVSYTGAVRFTGHGGILDVTVANPQVRITTPRSAALYVTAGGTQVHFADLDLAAGQRTMRDGAVTYAGVPARITSDGISRVLAGYATSLDPITFTIGAPAQAPGGSTGTVATAPGKRTLPPIPATPPSTEGIVLDDEQLDALQSGAPVTVTAGGFHPREQDIRVVVYSTPVLLGTVTADATGTATWSGTLPATLADGEHTLTFQGSVARGIRFTLARAAQTLGACTVENASLEWGFRESFRTYIEGIAGGGWELEGVTYDYPHFVWPAGSGAVDPEKSTGLVSYGGALRFTGHHGVLDTTFSDARIELAGDTGYLVFDISGTTQDGQPVDEKGVRFAEFALPQAADGGLVLDEVPATLTDAGAAAFGTYEAGTELDPISATLPTAGECGEAVAAPDAGEPVAAGPTVTATALPEESAPVWPWVVGGIALILVVGAAVTVVIVRRRGARTGA